MPDSEAHPEKRPARESVLAGYPSLVIDVVELLHTARLSKELYGYTGPREEEFTCS